MTGLHDALAALADEWRSSSTGHPTCAHDEDCVGCAADELDALLAEHPADLPATPGLRLATSRPALGSNEQQQWAVAVLDDGSEVRMRACGDYAEIRTWDNDEQCRPPVLAVDRVGPHVIDVRPAPADLPVATDSTTAECSTCEGAGEVVTMVPGSTGQPVEGVVDCPDCPAPEPSDRAGLSETERASVCPTCTNLPGMAHDPSQDMGCAWTESVITAVERILADRLAVAEQERTAQDWERELSGRAAAEQEATTLRAQVAAVEALHTIPHYCGDERSSDCFHPDPNLPGMPWPCPTLAALGDPGPWVDRLKTEGAAAALEQAASAMLVTATANRDRSHWRAHGWTCWLRERARVLRDGGDHG